MDMKKYTSILVLSLGFCLQIAGQDAPENIDYGVFPLGTYNGTPPANGTLEVCIRPDMTFPAVPAAAELGFYLRIADDKFSGSETFSITDDDLGGGDMLFTGVTFPWAGDTYIEFQYNGSGINLNPFGNSTWKHAFTVYIENMQSGTTAADWSIADASAPIWPDFGIRTELNIDGFNEFFEIAFMGALPLDLISFTAEKYNERSSFLEWVTVNEINMSHFLVQRSTDNRNWSTIGDVKAAGNSLSVERYNFIDADVYNGVDVKLNAHYRLVMVDLDGKTEVSPIATVSFGTKASDAREFLVYPNPASDGIHVEWDAHQVDQPTSIEFYDITGKLVYTDLVPEQINQQYVDFGRTNIKSGLYLMRVMSGTEAIEHQQIVVGQNR
jgi:hypothetical protein